MGFFATFSTWLNGMLSTYIGTNTAKIATLITPAIATLATVYVMVWGYLHLTGKIEEPVMAGLKRIAAHGADAVVVSLGVDTYKGDPISHFQLDHEHFTQVGRRIASLGRPTLFVMEGGYAVAEIGINAVNVLTGFEEG